MFLTMPLDASEQAKFLPGTAFRQIPNTFSVRLFRSVVSATEAISLALHSVSHDLKVQFPSKPARYARCAGGATFNLT